MVCASGERPGSAATLAARSGDSNACPSTPRGSADRRRGRGKRSLSADAKGDAMPVELPTVHPALRARRSERATGTRLRLQRDRLTSPCRLVGQAVSRTGHGEAQNFTAGRFLTQRGARSGRCARPPWSTPDTKQVYSSEYSSAHARVPPLAGLLRRLTSASGAMRLGCLAFGTKRPQVQDPVSPTTRPLAVLPSTGTPRTGTVVPCAPGEDVTSEPPWPWSPLSRRLAAG